MHVLCEEILRISELSPHGTKQLNTDIGEIMCERNFISYCGYYTKKYLKTNVKSVVLKQKWLIGHQLCMQVRNTKPYIYEVPTFSYKTQCISVFMYIEIIE